MCIQRFDQKDISITEIHGNKNQQNWTLRGWMMPMIASWMFIESKVFSFLRCVASEFLELIENQKAPVEVPPPFIPPSILIGQTSFTKLVYDLKS